MDQDLEGFRLSPQQRRLWQLQGGDDAGGYRVRAVLKLEGALDEDALRRAVAAVVQRHEILRTRFACLPGTTMAVQFVAGEVSVEVGSAAVAGDVEEVVDQLMTGHGDRALSVGTGPLLHVELARLADDLHLLALSLPAMCSDARGMQNLAQEVAAAYAGGDAALEDGDEPMQYADLAEWQNELLEDDEQRFGPPSASAELPFVNGVNAGAFAPALCKVEVDADVLAAAREVAGGLGVDDWVFYLTCWRELLGRLADGELVVGVACDGRSYEGLDRALGLFTRDLPLQSRLDPASSLEEAMRATSASVADLADRQEYFAWPDDGAGGRGADYFAASFAREDRSLVVESGGVKVSVCRQRECTQPFAVRLVCAGSGEATALELHYDASRCSRDEIARLATLYGELVGNAVAAPGQPVSDLSLLGDAERERLLVDFNQTSVDYSTDRCIHQLIEAWVESRPEHLAVACDGRQLSYAELDQRAGALAGQLASLGVGPDVLVGLCVRRSVDLAVGILGILKAGGAYVPMDPAYPRERIAFMLRDTAAPVVVCPEELTELVAADGVTAVTLESLDLSASAPDSVSVSPDHRAYIIYTSGSTGKPKGVEVTHRNLVHSTVAREHFYDGPVERYLLLSSFSFDSSVVGIFWTLCQGGTLVIPAEGQERDLHEITRLIGEHSVTHTLALPSLWSVVLRETGGEGLGSLGTVMVAGEACPRELVELHGESLPGVALYNEYGPTENTVWSTAHRCEPGAPGRKVSIGRPIPNVRAYILDAAQRPVPVGVPGELYVGGAGVTRGYLNRPELTAERFIDDPFQPGGRLYRTGDLVRFESSGDIEFLGRVDNQVKIRGYRIELEEIEDVLSGGPGVVEAAVVVREDASGAPYLAAYLIGREASAEALQTFLAARLPEYMVPGSFTVLPDMPRMPNGKVDRAALPEPGGPMAAAEFVAPRDAVEEALAGIWAELLGVDRVGVNDNFFQLGGHSLLVTQMVFRLRELFQAEVPLRAIFDEPTVAALAGALRADEAQRERVERVAGELAKGGG